MLKGGPFQRFDSMHGNEVMEDHVCSCFFFVRGPAFFSFFCKKKNALENQFTVIVVVRCFLNLSVFFFVLVAFLRLVECQLILVVGMAGESEKLFSQGFQWKIVQPLELGDEMI